MLQPAKDGAAFPSGDTMAGSVTGASLALAGCGSGWWLLGLYVSWALNQEALGKDGKLLGQVQAPWSMDIYGYRWHYDFIEGWRRYAIMPCILPWSCRKSGTKAGLWNVGFTLAAIVTIPKSSPSLWVLLCLPSSVMVGLWQPGFSHMSIHFQHQPSDLSSRRVPFHDQKRLNWVILVSKWSTSTEENNLVYHCNILIYIVINVFPWTWNKMEILLRIPHLTQSQLLLPKLPVVSGTGSFSYSWENSPDVSGTKLCWDWRNCDGVGTVRKDTGNLGNLTIRVEPR